MKWTGKKEELNELINIKKLSYEKIGRIYGCTGSNIKKVARKLGITMLKRRKINLKEEFKRIKKTHKCLNCGNIFEHKVGCYNKYCSTKCEKEYKHKQKYQKIIDGDKSIMRANYNPYAFKEDILKEQGGVCAICELPPIWNGKPLVFILDHIDGHASNNKRDNLRCICPNCDSQLDTYKSKNKNGDRHYYRFKKYENENK